MKKVLILVSLSIFIMSIISCDKKSANPIEDEKTVIPTASLMSDFNTNLFKTVISKEPIDKNVIISPISISTVMQMILQGADGNTASEITKTLGEGLTAEELINNGKNFNDWLSTRKGNPILELSNAAFYDKNRIDLLSQYSSDLVNNFNASLFNEDFADTKKALGVINSWVDEKTKGRIPTILQEISSDEVMFLVNALYLKADWKDGFVEDATFDRVFTLQDGTEIKTPTMLADRGFNTYADDDIVSVELPYKDEEISMYLIKPTHGDVNELITSFDFDKFKQMKEGLEAERLMFSMPKFKVEYKNEEMKKCLEDLGIKDVFTSNANLSKMAEQNNLAISRVVHKTYMTVDERGTEGAAVTAAGVVNTSLPPQVDFNSPFIFVLADKASDNFLFMGRISDPSK